MSDPHPSFLPDRPTRRVAEEFLAELGHPRPGFWLDHHRDSLGAEGDPRRYDGAAIWRRLLQDECDKLYNQAHCALEQIRDAQDEDSAMMLAMDDLPSAVEQAWSLAPQLADEHLQLLRDYKEARYADFCQQLGVGSDREAQERADCLEFWEENAVLTSELRKRLYREVRRSLLDRE